MALTKLENLVDPEVMGNVVSATLPKKIKFKRLAKIDKTLVARPGSTITIPKYGYIGDASDVPEGTPIDIAKLTTTTSQATVKKAGKGVELSDEAVLSGIGDPMGEAAGQLTLSIASKVDNDCYESLCESKFAYNGVQEDIGYAPIVKANTLFEDESDEALEKVMYIAPAQAETLLLDPKFISKDNYDSNVMITGEIGRIAGARISKSKKVAIIEYEKAPEGTFTVTEATEGQSDGSHKRLDEVQGKVLGGVKVGDRINAAGTKYYANPIVIIDPEDPNEAPEADGNAASAPALTIYMKKGVEIESDRDIVNKSTVMTADEHYVTSLSNESKVVIAKLKAPQE